MEHRIVVDSCCDVTPELSATLGLVTVPLTMTLGEKSYVDDNSLDLPQFMHEMKNCKERIGSASPSPVLYQEAFETSGASFAVTLSSNLSGSYASAVLGKSLLEKDEADIHIFDSKSASAGETLIALKISDMLRSGDHKSKIISSIESFINEMKTYFVLDNMDNLVKNGRVNKIVGKLVSVLNIRPIMGSDGKGNIALFSHARGQNQILEKLVETIKKSGKKTEGESLVITHCNNHSLAEQLMNAIKSRYQFARILIVPTRGISSVYANEKGIIMAF